VLESPAYERNVEVPVICIRLESPSSVKMPPDLTHKPPPKVALCPFVPSEICKVSPLLTVTASNSQSPVSCIVTPLPPVTTSGS
jgi:hypothetical protein